LSRSLHKAFGNPIPIASVETCDKAMYSACVEEIATVACFVLFQQVLQHGQNLNTHKVHKLADGRESK